MKKLVLALHILVALLFSFSTLYASNTFYLLNGTSIELKVVQQDGSKGNFITLPSVDGTQYQVSEKSLINSSDFEGLELQPEFTILFLKKEFWHKLRSVTSQHLNKELAIVIDGKILSVAKVIEPLTRSIYLAGIKKENIEDTLKRLKSSERPEYLDSHDTYQIFLENWIKENPNDYPVIKELVYSYMMDFRTGATIQPRLTTACDKALPWLEKLNAVYPNDITNYTNLYGCFFAQKKFKQAVDISLESIPKYNESDKWLPYMSIGIVYIAEGSYSKAIQILEKSKAILLQAELLPKNIDPQFARLIYQNQLSQIPLEESLTIEDIEAILKNQSLEKLNSLIEKAEKGKAEQAN